MAKVTIDNLADAIMDMLEEYGDNVAEHAKEATHKVALLGVRALTSASPGKKYKRGWRTWSETSFMGQKETIYNDKQPGLAHLLEHGHAKRNGGRTKAIIHIKPVEEELIEKLQEEVQKAINDS